MSTKTRFAVRFLTDADVPFRTCDDPQLWTYHQPHGDPGSWKNVVYEAYAARGEKPLYVGQTGNFAKRWRIHARTSPWWSDTRFVLLTFAPCLDLTTRYELLRIRSLRPVHNRQGNPDWMAAQPPQKRRPRRPAAVPAPAPAPDLDLDAAARERADAIRREHGPVPADLTERVAALLRAQSTTERRTA